MAARNKQDDVIERDPPPPPPPPQSCINECQNQKCIMIERKSFKWLEEKRYNCTIVPK